MGTLSYTATISLDGYAAGPDGDFQFGAPTPKVFDVHLARMGDISTEILGRRTHGLMTYWEGDDETWGEGEREFAAYAETLHQAGLRRVLGHLVGLRGR